MSNSIGTKWTEDATKISNWDTAYSWGDHGTEGYLTSFDITTQTDPKYLRADASDTTTGTISAAGFSSQYGGISSQSGSFVTSSGDITTSTGTVSGSTISGTTFTCNGNMTVSGTVDGVDIATRDAVLTSTTATANSALQNLVADTTPQLGADLDLNGNDITGTGNISITQSSTSTPALHIYNADTSDVASPTIRLERRSTMSVSDDDNLGKVEFYGFRDGVAPIAPTVEYANITGVINDGTTSTIDGQIDFNVAKDDTLTTVMSVSPTQVALPNSTYLYVDGEVSSKNGYETSNGNYATVNGDIVATNGNITAGGSVQASNVDISTTGSVTTNIATGLGGSGNTKTVNIGTGYSSGGTTTVNIAPTSSTTLKQINLNGNVDVAGTFGVGGTDILAALAAIPYHRVKEIQLSGNTSGYGGLGSTNSDLGQVRDIFHDSTPVPTTRYADASFITAWEYVTSATNDVLVSLYLTVPSGATATALGTITSFQASSNYSTRQGGEQWYYVTGDHTHYIRK